MVKFVFALSLVIVNLLVEQLFNHQNVSKYEVWMVEVELVQISTIEYVILQTPMGRIVVEPNFEL